MTDAKQDYLQAIYSLEQELPSVRSVNIAHRLGYSKASVHNALRQLEEEGYLLVTEDKRIRLTQQGREIAEKLSRRSAYFEKILTDAGVDPLTAGAEARKMGRCVCDRSFDALTAWMRAER